MADRFELIRASDMRSLDSGSEAETSLSVTGSLLIKDRQTGLRYALLNGRLSGPDGEQLGLMGGSPRAMIVQACEVIARKPADPGEDVDQKVCPLLAISVIQHGDHLLEQKAACLRRRCRLWTGSTCGLIKR